jgi:predicted NACHT family NTPase
LAALGGEESTDEDVTLDRVYVALNTRTPVPLTEEEKRARQREPSLLAEREDTRPLTALEAATQSRRLVLLGDPGGGKSTFVRQLVAWLAAHQLGEGEPPPEGMASGAKGLLPVLITLRDLAPGLQARDWDALPADDRRAALARAVRDQALAGLERLGAEGFAEGLDQALSAGDCLLAFDGLDEVPPALRRWVRHAIQAAIGHYAPPRVIVTCRVRSYTGPAVLSNFEAHTLVPFDPDQVRAFVAAWYAAQRDLGRLDAVEAGERTADLQGAALAPELQELSANPMLLTTMAIIHQKEIGLRPARCWPNWAIPASARMPGICPLASGAGRSRCWALSRSRPAHS